MQQYQKAVAEAARVAIQAMTTAEVERPQNVGPKLGEPIMKQLTFNSNSTDKYTELRNFRLEVKNMFQNYRISHAERVPIIKNWLGRQNPQLLESLTQPEQEVVIQKMVSLKCLITNLDHLIMRPSNLYNFASK